ncbi:alpha-glucosidase family protein [Amantichitinum ursilacus]|uniref:Oligo-1,6-glucosidase n=1 Tax=Amantichitinum ursilacus TaxID=857265 RepID=A0A0N0GKR4_9NEIS|nr:alpha-glucosidase family protein [Amantichitinum ursilacus]KPC49284.1 Oligo-1,6-glucosidase [Amantichitinum ursilacus]
MATLWWQGALIYQIYPRSYQDSNGDGIGDLPGITQRLPYVASLGVQAIWISPFFTSPMLDFGYDVADYCDVDPMFGTLSDFEALTARAHELGLKVIIDLVLSHTSEIHPWFIESRASRDNARANWYVWAECKPDGTPPNNWLSVFGGPAWQWDTRREQYYLHNFLVGQPDLNFREPQVQDEMLRVARFWLDRGVDGFRLDAVNFYTHDDQLRDNPPMPPGRYAVSVQRNNPYSRQRHLYDKSRPENLDFLHRLRGVMDQYPGSVTIGELGDDDQYLTLAQYTKGQDYLHMAYVFALLTADCNAQHVHDVIAEYLRDAPLSQVCWSLSNHDFKRVVTRWAALGGTPLQRAHLLIGLLLSLPGAVCVYQGEELGLQEADVPFEHIQDPYGKAMWPEFKGRDGCRTPMPWTNTVDVGFSSATPWLPVGEGHAALAVSEQEADAESVLAHFRRFTAWRNANPSLQIGDITLLPTQGEVALFLRRSPQQTLLCAFNLSDQVARVALPKAEGRQSLEGHGFTARVDGYELVLPPLQAGYVHLHGYGEEA